MPDVTARIGDWLRYRRTLRHLLAEATENSYGVISRQRYEAIRSQARRGTAHSGSTSNTGAVVAHVAISE